MVAPVRSLLFSLLLSLPLFGAVPVGQIRYVPAGEKTDDPIATVSGDRALVIWNRGDGAVRFGADAQPLDVPAIALPKPQFTSGVDVVATESGWTVGWTIFDLGDLATSSLQLVDVDRDGALSGLRVFALPEIVPQNAAMQLAVRGGVTVVAYETSVSSVAVAEVDARGHVNSRTVSGQLTELASTPSGFALVLRDRVVLLPSMNEIALPAGFVASDIEADGDDLLLTGVTSGSVVIVRVRDGAASVIHSIASAAGFVRFARNGRELLVTWKRPITPYFGANTSWDLMSARVVIDGEAGAPSLLRSGIDLSGRFVCCVDPPAVVAFADAWTLLWSEGYRSAGIGWRNIFASRVASGSASIDEPRLMTYRAARQYPGGTAHRDGVVFAVWQEGDSTYAARFTAAGQRIDAQDIFLGTNAYPRAVRATPSGFAVLTAAGILRIDANGAVATSALPTSFADLSCTATECLLAWIEAANPNAGPATVRVSRWRDGELLDAPGIGVHHSDTPYSELTIANDGERFLVMFARGGSPGGSILTVAKVDGMAISSADIAASDATITNAHILFEGNGYLATWLAREPRASRLSREGDSLDGDETNWQGWLLGLGVSQLTFDGERTLVVSGSSYEGYTIYELRGRDPVAVDHVDALRASIECTAPRRCVTLEQRHVRGWPWYDSERLFLTGASSRRRATRQ
ncbi:MAG TPA: hypothetical protein VM733_05940 [Thermoanaerobaculia bacterium]|nr:hypothetical protein [Thermoanaerobaculia bacterium]